MTIIEQDMAQLDALYQIAMKKLKYKIESYSTQLALLNTNLPFLEFNESITSFENNPIEHLKYRIKKKDSIQEKLEKKNLPITIESIRLLNDVVGARIVCSFLDDMNNVIDFIKQDPEIKILNCKNYIDTPKQNGYMSYHMNIEIPVLFRGKIEQVKAEIQIRTIAMDMWASLEHKIWYKKGIELPLEMRNEIDEIAIFTKKIDERLNNLAKTASFREIQQKNDFSFMNSEQYEKDHWKYEKALQYMEVITQTIEDEYREKKEVNPIEHVKGRIKSLSSINSKLQREAKDLNLKSIEENINDIAGFRIVCSFKSDIPKIVDLLKKSNTLKVFYEKNYIKHPKPSGYRAYHLLIGVPVFLQGGTEYVKVEVQIRTIAMDMWASLEHKLCYHKNVSNETRLELLRMSGTIKVIDEMMDGIIETSKELVKTKNKKLAKSKSKELIKSKNETEIEKIN